MVFKQNEVMSSCKTVSLVLVLFANNGCITGVSDSFFTATPSPPPVPSPIPIQSSIALGNFSFLTSISNKSVWLVTTSPENHIYLQSLVQNSDGTFPAPKIWNYQDAGQYGARTYVTQSGLFFGKNLGKLYHVSQDTPTGPVLKPIWTAASAWNGGDQTRTCVTSYQVNGAGYIGVAYNQTRSVRMFTQFPINASLPDSIDLTQERDLTLQTQTGQWAYSCFTDQARNYFWSTWGGEPIGGVNLSNLTENLVANAPNAGQATNPGMQSLFIAPGSNGTSAYAMSGDKNGNILTGPSGIYTYAHDPVSDLVYSSFSSGSNITIAPADCYSTSRDCSKLVKTFSTTGVGADGLTYTAAIGPISALSDGRIVALNTSTPSQVYLISLVNPADYTQGISFTRVAALDNARAYMYTDFTGATLYPLAIDQTYDLTSSQFVGYNPAQHAVSASFTWTSSGGGVSPWQNLVLQGKCYKGATPPADLETVTGIQASGGAVTPLNIPSCQAGGFDHIRLNVTALAGVTSSNFSRATQIQISVQQSQ